MVVDGPEDQGRGLVDEHSELEISAYTAILQAYYPDALRAASNSRDRSRAGYALVAGVATAVLALFTGTSLADRSLLVRMSGAGSGALWLLATGLYLVSVVAPPLPDPSPQMIESPLEFARFVLERAKTDRNAIEEKLRIAVWVSVFALAATAFTFGAYAMSTPRKPTLPTVSVPNDENAPLSEVCKNATNIGRLARYEWMPSIDGLLIDLDSGGELFVPRSAVGLLCFGA